MLTSNLLSETFLIQATSLADETANASMPVRESAKSVVRVSYTIEAVGDFQGESNADILLSSNNGDYVLWLAGQQENAFSLGNKKGFSYYGVGDFDNNQKSDIIFYENSTAVVSLLKSPATAQTEMNPIGNLSALLSDNWEVIATADFDRNGCDDIMWMNNGGIVGYWASTPTGVNDQLIQIGNLSALLSEGWEVIGIGDFDGNGCDDVLWKSNFGLVGYWAGGEGVNGAMSDQLTIVGDLGAILEAGWDIVGIEDFDGNGCDDILWQSGDLLVGYWRGYNDRMDDQLQYSGNLTALVHEGWNVKGVGDFDADGKADILWQSDVTNLVGMWGAGSDQNWVELGSLA